MYEVSFSQKCVACALKIVTRCDEPLKREIDDETLNSVRRDGFGVNRGL